MHQLMSSGMLARPPRCARSPQLRVMDAARVAAQQEASTAQDDRQGKQTSGEWKTTAIKIVNL